MIQRMPKTDTENIYVNTQWIEKTGTGNIYLKNGWIVELLIEDDGKLHLYITNTDGTSIQIQRDPENIRDKFYEVFFTTSEI